ncbi:hypothetical protein [Microbispora sp. H10830]|uniref:hypothetical protein n=1 Tax=Microbispora sp. H10830 TaxID=2729109 RepID=UPI0016037971|nr:hypothetical protein [Microbispora sp. H10830]
MSAEPRFHKSAGSARRALRLSAAAALGLAVLLSGPPAAAAQGDPIADALARVADGTYTNEDLELLKSDPEIAAQVPDPTKPDESSTSTNDDASTHAICGAYADVWFRKRSLLGSTIYVWHHRVVYCRDGSRVTSWQNRYDYLSDAQSIVYMRELLVNQAGGVGTTSAWSHLQRHLEYCVAKYGCYASMKPWSRITVHGNATYSYTGSAG